MNFKEVLVGTAANVWRQIRARGAKHWFWLGILIGASLVIGAWLDDQPIALALRGTTTQVLHSANPVGVYPTHSIYVAIGDNLFYGRNLGKAPFSPKTLAAIVWALDKLQCGPIGIDVELTDPDPQRPMDTELRKEVAVLKQCLNSVGERRPIILPVTLRFDGTGFNTTILGDLTARKWPSQVQVGFVNVAEDNRFLPTYVERNGEIVHSFAIRMARAVAGEDATRLPLLRDPISDHLARKPPIVGFLNPGDLQHIDAADLLSGDAADLARKVRGRAVIVGARWSRRSNGSGQLVDQYQTAVGMLPGALLQQNYIEQILHDRTYPMIDAPWIYIVKLLALAAIGIVVALAKQDSTKFLVVIGVVLVLVLAAYQLFIATALAADLALPLLLILVESAAESISEWRRVAIANGTVGRDPAGG